MKTISLLLLISAALYSCDLVLNEKLFNQKGELIEDNHNSFTDILIAEKQSGDINFTAVVKNYNHLQLHGNNTKQLEIEETGSYEIQYEIDISEHSINPLFALPTGQMAVRDILYYYSYRFEQDVYLKKGNQKIYPSYCIFQKDIQLSSNLKFSIEFPVQSIDPGDQLVVEDHVFGLGTVKLKFTNKNLKSINYDLRDSELSS